MPPVYHVFISLSVLYRTLDSVNNEILFSDYVINAINAFSREHTQWIVSMDT